MTHSISTKFERVGLHDSFIDGIKRDSGSMVINLSHGFLQNFIEEDINEAIMFGESVLILTNVIAENYRNVTNGESLSVDKLEGFETDYSLISENEFLNIPNNQTLKLRVFRDEFSLEKDYYIEWIIKYERALLEWDKHILHINWLNGTDQL